MRHKQSLPGYAGKFPLMSRTLARAMICTAAIAVIAACQPRGETTSPGPSATPEPSTTPAGTLAVLYGDEVFFGLRNSIPASALDHLSACITPELRGHFERHNESVAQWMEILRNPRRIFAE